MCPLYVSGLIGPGDRKSVQPMAKRLVLGEYDQLHHFIAAGVWEASPVETELLVQADRLVGGRDAVLVIDDTALPKKGTHSVGVAAQYASALGKTANCQTMVSLTLARGEVPVMLALRLFLPESWTSNQARLERVGVPADYRTAGTKPEIALAEIDRAIAAGVRFGCVAGGCRVWAERDPPGCFNQFPHSWFPVVRCGKPCVAIAGPRGRNAYPTEMWHSGWPRPLQGGMLHPAKLRGCIEGVAGRDDRSAARELAMVARKDRRPQSRTTRASKKLIGFRPGRDFLLRLA
jgi:hypothetical protein